MAITRLGTLTRAHVNHMHDLSLLGVRQVLTDRRFPMEVRINEADLHIRRIEPKVLGRSRKVLKRLYGLEEAKRTRGMASIGKSLK